MVIVALSSTSAAIRAAIKILYSSTDSEKQHQFFAKEKELLYKIPGPRYQLESCNLGDDEMLKKA